MQFIDEATIHLTAGNGGNGSSSFRREKFIQFGGPDGGNGGSGGGVVFRGSKDVNTLIDYRFQQHFIAKSGESGRGKNQSGASGENLILIVPVGTQIFELETHELLADISSPDQEVTIVKGGRGGLGNINFKSSVNQAPEFAQKGEAGEKLVARLELKLLSDVGLLGLPNAGKSTFLANTTRAKPKIADYPFTTLKPQLGVVYINNQEFVVADIPGIIKGASVGKGLGDRFLKHIERCRILLHLIDITSEDIVKDYEIIREELNGYSKDLLKKNEIIALTKTDLLTDEEVMLKTAELQKYFKETKKDNGIEVMSISAVTHSNLKPLLNLLLHKISG